MAAPMAMKGAASIAQAVGARPAMLEPAALDSGDPLQGAVSRKLDYDVLAGVAVIPVRGVLMQAGGLIPNAGMWWWYCGYNHVRQKMLLALNDPEVKAIALDINSPGGEVSGCFDLVDTIHAMRGDKPIWAILNENAFSAAYAIASACDHITVPRTGGTGSIGVIAVHVDFSAMMAKEGIKFTVITYGDHKADGHPAFPLSKDAAKSFQHDLDVMGDLFVETVARNRKVTSAKIRDTQAATYLGSEGVAAGLADEVLAPDAAFRSLVSKLG